jgi:hypothetical protein
MKGNCFYHKLDKSSPYSHNLFLLRSYLILSSELLLCIQWPLSFRISGYNFTRSFRFHICCMPSPLINNNVLWAAKLMKSLLCNFWVQVPPVHKVHCNFLSLSPLLLSFSLLSTLTVSYGHCHSLLLSTLLFSVTFIVTSYLINTKILPVYKAHFYFLLLCLLLLLVSKPAVTSCLQSTSLLLVF